MNGQLLTVSETALYLRVSEDMVRRLVAARKLAAIRVGRCVRINTRDLQKYLAQQRIPPADHAAMRASILTPNPAYRPPA